MGTRTTLAAVGAIASILGLSAASTAAAAPESFAQPTSLSATSLYAPILSAAGAGDSSLEPTTPSITLPQEQIVLGTVSNIKGSIVTLKTQEGRKYSVETIWARIAINGAQPGELASLNKGDLIYVSGFVYDHAIYADLLVQLRHAPAPQAEQFNGTVLSIGTNNFVLDTGSQAANTPRLILAALDAATTFTKNNQPATKADLALNDTVTVKGIFNRAQNSIAAQSVIITGSLIPVPPTTTPTTTPEPTTTPTPTTTPVPTPTTTPTTTPDPTPVPTTTPEPTTTPTPVPTTTPTPTPVPTSSPTGTPTPEPTSTPPVTTTPTPVPTPTTTPTTTPEPTPMPTSTPEPPTTTVPEPTTTPPVTPPPAPEPTTTPGTPSTSPTVPPLAPTPGSLSGTSPITPPTAAEPMTPDTTPAEPTQGATATGPVTIPTEPTTTSAPVTGNEATTV